MGGLRKYMPYTFWTMTIATFTIAGFPPLAAFFSKDEILWRTYASGQHFLWLIGVIAAGMTSFYMFRLWFLTFFGEYRGVAADDQAHGSAAHDGHDAHGHDGHGTPHESPFVMTVPLMILAVLCVVGGWVGIPEAMGGSNHFEHFLAPVFSLHAPAVVTYLATPTSEELAAQHAETGTELLFSAISVAAAAIGFLGAWFLYFKRTDLPPKMAQERGQPVHLRTR